MRDPVKKIAWATNAQPTASEGNSRRISFWSPGFTCSKQAQPAGKDWIVRKIGAFEAKNPLGALLDLVEHGEEVVITRRGKPVARLVREAGTRDPAAAIDAARRIIANRKGRSLGGLNIKDLVNEGRP